MSGRRTHDERAQLALLDAMVFFAVSTVICSVMVSYSVSEDGSGGDVFASAAPEEVLSAYLCASLGKDFILGAPALELLGSERVGEVLFLLMATVLDGGSLEVFEPLLSHCGEVLAGLCGPWSHLLRLSSEDGGGTTILIMFGCEPDEGADATSSSQNLGTYGGADLTATLVLSPALLVLGDAV